MKKALSIILALIMVLSTIPFAYAAESETSGQCGDNAYWSFDTATKTLTITGSGKMWDFYSYNQPWVDFKEEIETVIVEPGLNIIGNYAFGDCTNLTSVTISDSVTSIGNYAFYDCGLTSITIPDSVTSIGDRAFYYCSRLTSITIPDSVTSIGNSAFNKCTGLTSIIVDKNNTIFDSRDNCNAIVKTDTNELVIGCNATNIPNSVTSIGNNAFDGCTGLTSITIPDGVTSIGNFAFEGCSGLTSITIPDSVTSIGDNAFFVCKHLTSITIPDSVTSIGHGAFIDCSGLTSINIPDGVTSIGGSAFEQCTGLTSVTIGNSVTSIGRCAFKNCSELTSIKVDKNNIIFDSRDNCNAIVKTDTNELVVGCKATIIPNSVTSIGRCAFYMCSSLTSITIPNSVTSIGQETFSGCRRLTSITIHDGVTSIGYEAFWNCTGLTSITIPNSVTSIGSRAFFGCRRLKSITIPDSVTNIGDNAFGGTAYVNAESNWEDGLLYIGKHFIAAKMDVTSASIKPGTLTIASAAFYDSGLTNITIPDSVTSIGERAFYRCDNLTDVYYSGSEMQWNRIDIKDENDPLLDATVHFNDESDDTTSGQCGENAYWSFDIETKTLTITGSGEMWDFPYVYDPSPRINSPWIDFIDEIVTVIVEPGLTNIGGNAFNDCTNLTSVSLPDGITEIKFNAFENCKSLENIQLSESLISIGGFAFAGCEKLENIQLPEYLISIDQNAFSDCRSLKSIVIPEGVSRVDIDVFMNCFGLESVTIPSSLEYIPDILSNCFSLKEIKVSENNPNYLDVDGVLFNKDKSELKIYPARKEGASYTIPSGVKRIAECAFGFNTNLKEVTVCDDVEELGRYAFLICLNLERLNLGEGIKKIGEDAFLGLFNLKNDIILNEGLEEIGDFAFEFLSQSEITIPSTVTSIGEKAFDSAAVDTIVNKSKVASLPLSDFYTSKQSRIMMNDFYKVLYQELYRDGYDGLEEKELKAFVAAVSYINEKYDTSFISTDDLIYYCKTDGSDKPYYNIVCYEDSVQHEVCIENGFTHSIIDSTCDDACGKHNIYTNDIMEPTCTDNGYKGGVVCLDCEKIFEAATVIPAKGHTETIKPGLAPTCTEPGCTDTKVCSECGAVLEDARLIQPNGHTDNDNNGICDECGDVIDGYEPEEVPETFSQRIINFFKGIVNAILELFKRLFG